MIDDSIIGQVTASVCKVLIEGEEEGFNLPLSQLAVCSR